MLNSYQDHSAVAGDSAGQNTLLIDIATRNVACLAPDDSMGAAAGIMAGKSISSIVVTDAEGRPAGIVTERNILEAMQSGSAPELKLQQVMSSPVVTVSSSITMLDAYQLCLRYEIRHLVIVDADGRLAGVASETDFRMHMRLTALAGRHSIASAMNRSQGLPPQTVLGEALALMQSQRGSCVVVVEQGRPVGIVTERDIVRLYTRGEGRAEVTLAEVMSAPVLTVRSDDSINEAARRMLEAGVRHLVVVDGAGLLLGMIGEHDLTQTMALGLMDSKLAAEGSFLRILLDSLPDLVWLKDTQGVYLACNARFERFLGAKERDIVGRSDSDFMSRGESGLFRARDRQLMDVDGPSVSEEWITYADDGHRELLETVETPMCDSDGNLIGVLCIARDITARKLLEKSLEHSEHKLRDIYDSVRDCIEIIAADGRIVDMNRIGYERLGYTREEMVGHFLSEFAAPEQVPYIRERMALLREQGYATFESVRLRKDGTAMPLEIQSRRAVLDGQEVFLGISRDITERKRTEDALRFIAQRGGAEKAESILGGIAQYLGKTLAVDYVLVDRLTDDRDVAETVALYARGGMLPNIRYALRDTPCENVMGRELCYYGRDVQQQFPHDALLAQMGVDSYAGIPLWDSAGKPIGLLAVMDGKPFSDEATVIGLLRLMAARAASELERARSERLLRMREREFRTLAENAPQNIVRYDRDCRMVYVNPRMLRTLDVTAEQMLGRTPTEVIQNKTSVAYEAVLGRVIRHNVEERFDLAWPDASGDLRYHSVYFVPERNGEGEVTGALAMGSDVTESKKAEMALAASESRYRALIENSPLCIHEIGLDGRLQSMNRAGLGMMGLDDESRICGIPYLSTVSTRDGDRIRALLQEATRGIPSHFEFTVAGDEQKFFKSCFVPIRDSGGEVVKLMGITEDITERKRAEAERRKLSAALMQSGEAIALTDTDARYAYANPAFCKLFGYELHELTGKSISVLMPPEDVAGPTFRQTVSAALEHGIFHGEVRRRAKDGRIIPILLRVSPFRDEQNTLSGYIASMTDLTEIKQMEEELRESEKHYRDIIEQSPLGMMTVTLDGRFIQVNQAFCVLVGYPEEELINLSFDAITHPDDVGISLENIKKLAAGNIDSYRIEKRYIHRDGHLLWAQVDTSMQRGLSGEPQCLICQVRDITVQKRAEEALQHGKARIEMLLNSVAEGIYGVDMEGRCTFINAAGLRMLGYRDESELTGKLIHDLVHHTHADGSHYPAEDCRLYSALHLQESVHVDDELFWRKDGTAFPVDYWSRPTTLNGERGAVVTFLDITERKRAEILLLKQKQFADDVINSLPGIFYILDRRGHFVRVNPLFRSVSGYSATELEGMSALALFEGRDRELIEARIGSVFETGSAWAEAELITKSGRKIPYYFSGHLSNIDGVPYLVGLGTDITERRRAEEALRINASVFDTSQEAILITDADNRIVDVNPAFTRITGYGREEVLGQNPKLLSSGRNDGAFYASMWKTIGRDKSWRGEIWNRRKSGETYAELLSISVICDEQGRVQRHIGVFSDISQIKAHEAELSRVAHYDALTGIPNRVLLADRMKQAIAQTSREQVMMAICYLDLDGFKPINDNLGHEAGDQVLIEIARRIGHSIRGGDTVARLGGDEFVVLLLGLERGEECVATLNRLLAAISEPIVVMGQLQALSASIGVSIYPLDDEDADTLLRHADQAMYVAKQSGKNRFYIYDPALDQRARDRMEFVDSVRSGLRGGQFELYYQPKINLRTRQLVGVEALLRWRHPERGLLAPGEFLRSVENTELDVEIGDWVIASALAQVERWLGAGLDIEVSVNVSAYHLESARFTEKLRQQFARFPGVPPDRLQIEVLETAALDDLAIVRDIIESCRRFGVGFALDDFGTGYSSLSYLSNLPIDVLKIDQSFVRDMLEDKGDRAIVQGIIALARAFERETVAEGIETAAHHQALLDMGCEVGQGYGIAHPMRADELDNWEAK